MTELCFNTMNHSAWLGIDAHLADQVPAAVAAGYRLFGPDVFSLRQLEEHGTKVGDLADLITSSGMRCFEIAALGISEDRDASLHEAHDLARLAQVLRPDWVMVNGYLPFATPGIAELVDECAAILTDAGTGLGFEFLPFTGMGSIAAALEYVHRARGAGARAGLIVDTWHVFRGPDGLDGLKTLDLADVAYVQFDDALPLASDDLTEETLHRRAMPGAGEFPLAEFCVRMREHGFDGVVSVEVLSSAWRDRPLAEFAKSTYDAAKAFWPD